MIVEKLTVEYRENPIGITVLKPRFSWTYSGESEKHTHYRIVVICDSNGEQVWDSGEIRSSETINIEYGGLPLQSSTVYLVKLFIKGENGSIYKKEATFETALLHEEDWRTLWYGSAAFGNGGVLWVRGIFSLDDKPIKRARIYLAAVDYHTLYVNGKKPDNRLLAPSFTDYTKRISYITYDVTKLFRAGKNCVGIEISQGFTGRRTAMMQIFVEYNDGDTSFKAGTGMGEWAMKVSDTTRGSIYGGEEQNAFLSIDEGWLDADYLATEEKGWAWPIHYVESGRKVSEILPPIQIMGSYTPIAQNVIENNKVVYDFGKIRNGWCRIKVKGNKGDKVVIKYAELLRGDGNIDQRTLRSAKCVDGYILLGTNSEEFAPKYSWRGFRYAEVSLIGTAKLLEIKAEQIANSLESTGSFRCSDENLNALHEMAVQTERNNQISILTDCPQRSERLGWLNDLTSRVFQNINNFDMALFFEKVSDDILDTQLQGGEIADTAPFMGGCRPADAVCISYLLLGLLSYRYYGDKRLLDEHFESYEKWVDFLVRDSEENISLRTNGIGDWTPTYLEEKTDNNYVATAYVIWHLRLMEQICTILGKAEKAEKYAKLKSDFSKAIIEKYYDAETCNFALGTQAANAMALSIGFAPLKDRNKILRNLIDNVNSKNLHSTSGNQGYRHLFSVLGDAGYADLLVKILKNPEYPGWGYMLENGATTVWEGWEYSAVSQRNSFDHPMFGSYDLLFYNYLAGLQIDEDAYACNKITIRPSFIPSIDFVECSLKTVRGTIEIKWKRENGAVYYDLYIPQGVSASVNLGKNAYLDGRLFKENERLSAGKYLFTVRE